MNIKEFLSSFKATSEQVSKLELEKLALESDFKIQAELVDSLKLENSTHSESITGLKAELENRDSKIAEYTKQISEFNKALADAESKEKTASEKAVEIVASVGISPIATIKTGSKEIKSSSNEDILNEYNSINDPSARSSFFAKNRDKILNK